MDCLFIFLMMYLKEVFNFMKFKLPFFNLMISTFCVLSRKTLDKLCAYPKITQIFFHLIL